MKMTAEKEEVLMELEAVGAVYGDDCAVLDSFPPHLHVHIKPRTADVSSQQFVEAVVGIQASSKYPEEPPCVELVDSKGLDEQRKEHLISAIQGKACQLSSCLMLVALCEEAVEKLSLMNHPDGNCPLCLYPLVPEDEHGETLPFMKLMSCFHCFHSECIIRWWTWTQKEKEGNVSTSSTTTAQPRRIIGNQDGMPEVMERSLANCPVCRKVFHAKDFEHVLDLVGTHSSQSNLDGVEGEDDEQLLQSESENIRRQKFEAILKLQQESSGLIEQKRELLVLPGMFLPQPAAPPAQILDKESIEQQHSDPVVTVSAGKSSGSSSNRSSSINNRNSGKRRPRLQNSKKHAREWVRKENGTAN